MTTTTVPDTPFVNVQVTATPIPEHPGKFHVVCNKPSVTLKDPDTVINYQLVNSPDIVFTGMTVVPDGAGQLSDAIVSDSGKLLTFSDGNTVTETFNIKLHLRDSSGVEFIHDPQVRNEPD